MKNFFLIGIIIILFIIMGFAVYIYTNKDELAEMVMEQSFNDIEQVTLHNLTSNYQASEIKMLINKAKLKTRRQGFGSTRLQALIQTFQASFKDQKIDSLEVKAIVEDLRAYTAENSK